MTIPLAHRPFDPDVFDTDMFDAEHQSRSDRVSCPRNDYGHITLEVTYEDPGTFTQPVQATIDLVNQPDNNLLEVRGIGLLDIRAIFGETAVRRKMRLKLIVHLVRRETLEREYERLPYEPLTQDVLGVPVRKAVIQVVAGRNIAVLVEAAVRNTILQLRGVDTYQEFVERHRRAMEQDK